jgi:excisionase family DNA binding protein
MSEEKLLTVREVARRCHRTEETVRRWIWSGKLRARKLGNQLFVSREDIDAMQRPRVSEAKVKYEAKSRIKKPETPEEKIAFFKDFMRFAAKMRKKYGPVDVAELIREGREGLE